MTTALAGRLTVEEIVATYESAEADIRRAFGVVGAALARLDGALSLSGPRFNLRRGNNYSHDVSWNEPEPHLRELRRQVWRDLVERMEIRKLMSISAWDALEAQIRNEEPPPISVATVKGMIDQFQADVPDMLQAAVKEVFEWLRPPRSQYKTNSEYEIGERVILRHVVKRGWRGEWGVEYDSEQKLLALENVFAIVGGMVPQQTGYYSALSTAIKACPIEKCHGATEWFEFRGHGNHNLHLRMRRMDLVRRLNAVAGGARLKPPEPRAESAAR